VGGNEDVLAAHPGAKVYGHRSDEKRIPGITDLLDDGSSFEIGSLKVHARHVPGHTLGAVTYVVSDPAGEEPPWAFTGDTLFLAGCGRLFEGTPAMMNRSLSGILGQLDPSTRVACGHEYTAANLKFALHVEPKNEEIVALVAEVEGKRARGEATVPGTIAKERATNPFLRVDVPAVRAHVGLDASADPVEVLARLREEKNHFKG
jgi:hydroxyacylglutathione hydrolase